MKKILIMGLPGSGKTTLAKILTPMLKAVHFNADEVRKEINSHLGFSKEDRVEQARRMGWLCDTVVRAGHYAIADFICPTEETRTAFGVSSSFVVWVVRISCGRFADTNKIFSIPEKYNMRVLAEGDAQMWAEKIGNSIRKTNLNENILCCSRKPFLICPKYLMNRICHCGL